MSSDDPEKLPGGIVHTYLGYDPTRFPMPAADAPDMVSPAFDHLLAYGSLKHFTSEELANAVELDPSQITGLGPSIESLLAMLMERKRRILETYETQAVRKQAAETYRDAAAKLQPLPKKAKHYERAVNAEQIVDLEKLWYAEDEQSDFARGLVRLMEHLGHKYEIKQLAAKYAFSGKREMNIPKAIEIKEELETIDRLIEQLKEAAKNAKVYLINLDELARFASEEQIEGLERLRQQVEEMLRHLAEEQGLHHDDKQFTLTPKAFKLFQTKLLDQIFRDLQAAKTGRHNVEITGDGAVEMQRTKPYEFGDSLANMDVPTSLINAMIREKCGIRNAECGMKSDAPPIPHSEFRIPNSSRIHLRPEDIEIHQTRNTPKCATVLCMDMSGSMRWAGQYIHVKRMALALHGLIRTEYPGDFVDFVEIYTLPKRRHISEVPRLLPKPVTTYEPWIRLKADMSDDRITERDIHPHFTNIQHGLALARQMLQVQDTPNRQIILITDGMPTAHFEDHWLYLLYPPDPRTEQFTIREGLRCREHGITINVFLLSSLSQSEEDVQFAHRLAETTQGRVVFVGGRDLDRFVVWDYLEHRRLIIG